MIGADKAHAETTKTDTVGILEKINNFFERGKVENNPYADTGFGFSFGGLNPEELQSITSYLISNLVHKASKYDQYISEIGENSIKLLAWVYEILVTMIIQVPAWVFDNSWFLDSYAKFAGTSVVLFTFLALINAAKKMFQMDHTHLRDIIRRYFLAVTGIGFGVFFFQQFSKVIRVLTKVIVSLGYHEITTKDFSIIAGGLTATVDTIALIAFNIVLLGLAVTLLIQNGRRWFKLGALGVLTPYALSMWVLNDKRHFFNEWKQGIMKNSLTQLYYAFFISLVGLFIAGTSGVLTTGGLIIKLSMIAGALTTMAKPPEAVNRLIDRNTDTVFDVMNKAKDLVNIKLNPAYTLGSKGAKKVLGFKWGENNPTLVSKRVATGRRYLK